MPRCTPLGSATPVIALLCFRRSKSGTRPDTTTTPPSPPPNSQSTTSGPRGGQIADRWPPSWASGKGYTFSKSGSDLAQFRKCPKSPPEHLRTRPTESPPTHGPKPPGVVHEKRCTRTRVNTYNTTGLGQDPISTPQVFYTYSYNHAHRPRLEKLFYLEPPKAQYGYGSSRSPNGYFKPLLGPHSRFTSATAGRRFQRFHFWRFQFQNLDGCYRYRSGSGTVKIYNGYIIQYAMAIPQRTQMPVRM